MSTVQLFQCSICKRRVFKPITPGRVSFFNCDITYKCRGQLKVINKNVSKTLIDDSEVIDTNISGLEDWKSRFSVSQNIQTEAAELLTNLFSGDKTIVLAIKQSQAVSNQYSIFLDEIVSSNNTYREYVYRVGAGASLLTGPDDSNSSSSLQIGASESTIVYKDGAFLSPNAYSVTSNSIELDDPTDQPTTEFSIIVYDDSQGTVSRELVFESIYVEPESTWTNNHRIRISNNGTEEVYKLYFLTTDIDDLQGSLLFVSSTQPNLPTVSDIFIPLGSEPFSEYEKNLKEVVSVESLVSNQARITYENGELNVDDSNIRNIFPTIYWLPADLFFDD